MMEKNELIKTLEINEANSIIYKEINISTSEFILEKGLLRNETLKIRKSKNDYWVPVVNGIFYDIPNNGPSEYYTFVDTNGFNQTITDGHEK